MKIKLYLFIFIIFNGELSFSQVSGYMGKRVVIGYSLNFSGAFLSSTNFKSNLNYTGGSETTVVQGLGFYGINNTHALNIDYIHHKRKSICFLVQYARTGLNHVSDNTYRYAGNYSKAAILNSLGIGVGIKLFKRENLAPYGPYVKWEGVMLLNKISYDNKNYSRYDQATDSYVNTKAGSGVISFQAFAIGFSWGRQRIFKDKFVFDRGVRFLVVPSAASNEFNSENHPSFLSEYETKGIERIFRHQLINFHIGIGFLAF